MLNKLNYYLDYPVKFFFINSKGNLLITHSHDLDEMSNLQSGEREFSDEHSRPTSLAKEARTIYNKQIRRYLGFGFVASFLPGTEAFMARKDYFSSLLQLHKKTEGDIESLRSKDHFLTSCPWHTNLIGIGLSPFFFLEGLLFEFYSIIYDIREFKRHCIDDIRKDSFFELMTYLPIISDIAYAPRGLPDEVKQKEIKLTWYKNLSLTFINPVRLVSSTLKFLHYTVYAIFELGADYNDHKAQNKASLPRQILKGIAAAFFIPFRLLIGVVEKSVDLVWSAVNALLIEPFRFVYEAGKQLADTWPKKFLYLPNEEYKGIKSVSQALQQETIPAPEKKKSKSKFQSEAYTLKIALPAKEERYANYNTFFKAHCNETMFTSNDIQAIAQAYGAKI